MLKNLTMTLPTMDGMTKMGGYAQAFACGDASTSSAAIVVPSVCL